MSHRRRRRLLLSNQRGIHRVIQLRLNWTAKFWCRAGHALTVLTRRDLRGKVFDKKTARGHGTARGCYCMDWMLLSCGVVIFNGGPMPCRDKLLFLVQHFPYKLGIALHCRRHWITIRLSPTHQRPTNTSNNKNKLQGWIKEWSIVSVSYWLCHCSQFIAVIIPSSTAFQLIP